MDIIPETHDHSTPLLSNIDDDYSLELEQVSVYNMNLS